MHVSLSPEIENLIKERVSSGLYTNASEVVRDALRKFFHLDVIPVSLQEAEYIRRVVEPRLEAVKAGTEPLLDFDEACDAAETDVFGQRVYT